MNNAKHSNHEQRAKHLDGHHGRTMTEDDIKEGRWVTNRRSGQRWEINWIDWDNDEVVMVGNYGRTRRISIDALLRNWIADTI